MAHDVFTRHYRVLATDQAARDELLADPKRGISRHFGSMPDGDYRVEVIEERADTITVLLPARPTLGETIEERLAAVDGRIYDILHTTGVGGYLIPDDTLTWVLRDMRARWARDADNPLRPRPHP
jgi:hypothetical protein